MAQKVKDARDRLIPFLLVVGVACMDPLINTFVRFWMSDIAAAAFFLMFVAALYGPFDKTGPCSAKEVFLLIAASTACIFIRISYVPAELLTVILLFFVKKGPMLGKPKAFFLSLSLIPVVSVFLLGASNSALFKSRFNGEFFVNKLSGISALSIVLPATDIDNFRAVGVNLTSKEFNALHVEKIDGRDAHIWNEGPQYVRSLIQSKLHIDDMYSTELDLVFRKVAVNTVKSHPIKVAIAYFTNLSLYFEPSLWARRFPDQIGLTRALPGWVTVYLHWKTGTLLLADDTSHISPIIDLFRRCTSCYPYVLAIGFLLAFISLLNHRRGWTLVPPACAFFATMASIPLYSLGLTFRFVIAPVLLTYIMLLRSGTFLEYASSSFSKLNRP
jgi:hypothetical protein